jgi:predicted Zn-ribbon and HTH transcriptional regulator
MAVGKQDLGKEEDSFRKDFSREPAQVVKEFRCPNCNYRANDQALGVMVRCPICDRATPGDFIEVVRQ